MSAPSPADRIPLIGDAAMAILVARGGRGLTHRAVDRALGWPEGSTSRWCRTRDALLTAAVGRLLEIDLAQIERWSAELARRPSASPEQVARLMREVFDEWVSAEGRTRHLARYELSLEGRRRPAVHDAVLAGRRPLNHAVAGVLEAIGCEAPALHATALVSYVDGLVHDHLLHPEAAAAPSDVEGLLVAWLRGHCPDARRPPRDHYL